MSVGVSATASRRRPLGLNFKTTYCLPLLLICPAALVLNMVLYRKLLPNTTFFLQAKKDGFGNPVFGD